MAAARSIGARFITSGMARVAATSLPFVTRVWVCRVAHITSSTMLKAASAAVFTASRPSTAAVIPILPSFGVVLPGDPLAGQRPRQDGGRLVLVDLVLGQVEDVEVVLAQLLQVADVLVAHRVTLAEGRALELAGPDLGDVVRQPGPHRILHVIFFSMSRVPSARS